MNPPPTSRSRLRLACCTRGVLKSGANADTSLVAYCCHAAGIVHWTGPRGQFTAAFGYVGNTCFW